MSSKRKSADPPDPTSARPPCDTSTTTTTPAKRQRVSRACDQCRSAREKCDGVHPRCFSCVFLNRPCTYNVAPKKRGVQTGLIRTLECALVWLFDNYPGSETALNDLLAHEEGRELMAGKGKRREEGNRLHKRWLKGKTMKEVERILSGKGRSEEEGDEGEEAGTSGGETAKEDIPEVSSAPAISIPAVVPKPDSLASRRYHLPPDAPRLLSLYFSYTHSWFPVLDKPRLQQLSTVTDRPVRDLELWAAIAVASFQDSTRPATAPDLYAAAQSLLPPLGEIDEHPEEDRTIRQVNGLLLLSLVSFGRDNAGNASLLVGVASRMLLHLKSTERPQSSASSSQVLRRTRSVMGCFILDTLAAMRLGQTPQMTPETLSGVCILPEDSPDEWDHWKSPSSPVDSFSDGLPTQAISSFKQLTRFFLVLSGKTPGTPTSLAAALDARFSFCNSILGSSPPFLPSALLLQISFLTITIALVPDARLSLLWTLIEAVEHAMAGLGSGTPPVLVAYMSIAGRVKGLSGDDRDRWERVLGRLKRGWGGGRMSLTESILGAGIDEGAASFGDISGERDERDERDRTGVGYPGILQSDLYSASTFLPPHLRSVSMSSRGFTASGSSASSGIHGGYTGNLVSSMVAQAPQYMLFPSSGAGGSSSSSCGQRIQDHEAILDELASIDCSEGLDADARFMANLGFAPGSEFLDTRREFSH